MSIHPTAIIDPNAKIGVKVAIDPYAIIGPGVTIGDRCHIRSHAVLEHVELGADCVVYPQASLGLAPQHLKYNNEPTILKVGKRCTFREGVTAHRGTPLDKSVTLIGDDCYFMALSHIAHDCRIGNKVIFANAAQIAGHVEIGNGTFVSTTVGIHQFVRIGELCMISGGAMVPLDVAPYCIAQGDRASVQGINLVGLKRAGADRESIGLIRKVFKAFFLSGLTLEQAMKTPELNVDNPYIDSFRNFFKTAKRGFLRPEGGFASVKEETVA